MESEKEFSLQLKEYIEKDIKEREQEEKEEKKKEEKEEKEEEKGEKEEEEKGEREREKRERVVDIEVKEPLSLSLKYFTPYFHQDYLQYIYQNPNGLCLVGLSEKHELIQELKKGDEIEKVSCFGDLANQKVSGRKKKGGKRVKPTSILCSVKCKSKKEYKIFSCISGNVIEFNNRLLTPQVNLLLKEKFGDEGFIAIISPTPKFDSNRKRSRHQQQEEESGEISTILDQPSAKKLITYEQWMNSSRE